MLFFAASKAFSQLFTPGFRSVLIKSLLLTLGLLVVAVIALTTLFGALTALPGWLEWTIQIAGALGLIFASVFLIGPITGLIASLFLDDIAAEVERVHYASDPPARTIGTMEGLGVALKFGLLVIGVNIIVLFLLLVPGINVIAFFAANGYLIGREYFELTAMRYMPRAEARRLRSDRWLTALFAGFMIAGMMAIPLLNLLTPIFATAFMVHVVKSAMRFRRI